MVQLLGEARGFLAADGFTVSEPEPGFLAGSRTSDGRTVHRRIWVGGVDAAPWTATRIAAGVLETTQSPRGAEPIRPSIASVARELERLLR
jgi:hypothetical protein